MTTRRLWLFGGAVAVFGIAGVAIVVFVLTGCADCEGDGTPPQLHDSSILAIVAATAQDATTTP